jgi:hypothetical protein
MTELQSTNRFVFRAFSVRNSAGLPAIANETFHGFPRSFKGYAKIVPSQRTGSFHSALLVYLPFTITYSTSAIQTPLLMAVKICLCKFHGCVSSNVIIQCHIRRDKMPSVRDPFSGTSP